MKNSNYKIHHGDCLKVLPTLCDDSVGIVFTSPVFNTGGKGKNKDMYGYTDDNLPDDVYYNLLNTSLRECLRICKGAVFYHLMYMRNNMNVLMEFFHNNSNYLKEIIAWDKVMYTPPIGNIFAKRVEFIYLFCKHNNYIIAEKGVNIARDYRHIFGKWISNYVRINTGMSKAYETNRATFSPSLPAVFIDIFTKEGDTVVDPFAGLMSTLVAAIQLKRKAIGIEISKECCKVGKERIEREIAQGKLAL